MNKPYHQRGVVRPRSPAETLEPKKAPLSPHRSLVSQTPSFLKTCVRFGSFVLSFLLVFMIYSGITFHLITTSFDARGPLSSTRLVIVDKGAGRFDIARKLEKEGVILNSTIFVINHFLRNVTNTAKPLDFKAGDYEFNQGVSMREVWDAITSGKVALYKITVPEGLTSQQIVERLNSENSLSGEIKKTPLEGSLLPDTYLVSRGTHRQEIITRMQLEQSKFIQKIWKDRQTDLPLNSIEEAMILASIVEKETGQEDERDRVASVFVNRLKKRMRLQSDPTIIYGLVGGAGSLGRSLTHNDVESKTVYNTYQINGLPPGPICNPGKSSILATLHPAKTNDLYFVADGTGGHTFSSNLNEHNSAVQVWRNISKQNEAEANGGDNADGVTPQKEVDVQDNNSNASKSSKNKTIDKNPSKSQLPLGSSQNP